MQQKIETLSIFTEHNYYKNWINSQLTKNEKNSFIKRFIIYSVIPLGFLFP